MTRPWTRLGFRGDSTNRSRKTWTMNSENLELSQEQTHSDATHEQLRRDLSWTTKNMSRAQLAHRGLMLDSIGKKQKMVRELARDAKKQEFGGTDVDGGGGAEEDEDMSWRIGDDNQYHNHYHVSNQETEQASVTQPVVEAVKKTALQKVAPYLLGAALTGGPLGGFMLANVMSAKPHTTPQPAVTDTDTDTQYELRISSGE